MEPLATTQPNGLGYRWRLLLAAACWGYFLLVIASWVFLAWGDTWWLPTLWLFAPRWLVLIPLVLLVPIALRWRPKMLLVLLAASLVGLGPVMGFCIPWEPLLHSPPPGQSVRVLTCNMHYGHGDTGPLDDLILSAKPDVVAIQEWPVSSRSALATTPGWHVHPGNRLFLASRFPIVKAIELGHDSKGEQASAQEYELETPTGKIRLISLHLASIRRGIYDILHDHGGATLEIDTNEADRLEQSEYLAGKARQIKEPHLLVGDFNTPPQSAIFPKVWSDYTDAFSSAGTGWGYTFYGSKTMVRIDHILASKGWYCSRCWVGPEVGSPHRPVLADLIWPASESAR